MSFIRIINAEDYGPRFIDLALRAFADGSSKPLAETWSTIRL